MLSLPHCNLFTFGLVDLLLSLDLQFIYAQKQILSHVQIRGTVPLFWEQPGLQVGSHKIKVFRFVETSLQAFNRHFENIISQYKDTLILNLMGSKNDEGVLSRLYKEHWNVSDYQVCTTR